MLVVGDMISMSCNQFRWLFLYGTSINLWCLSCYGSSFSSFFSLKFVFLVLDDQIGSFEKKYIKYLNWLRMIVFVVFTNKVIKFLKFIFHDSILIQGTYDPLYWFESKECSALSVL